MVDTAGLADPEEVWRGLYRFGPGWKLEPDDGDLPESGDYDVGLDSDQEVPFP
jgi:hypothetical protein